MTYIYEVPIGFLDPMALVCVANLHYLSVYMASILFFTDLFVYKTLIYNICLSSLNNRIQENVFNNFLMIFLCYICEVLVFRIISIYITSTNNIF